jgi:subtilase family serine protease
VNSSLRGRLVGFAASVALATGAVATLVPTSADAGGHARGSAPVCGAVSAGFARCAVRTVTVDGHPAPAAGSPSGLSPANLQSAYKLPSSTAGAGQTVAIVDAYNDPNAEADLGVYRSQFGLPPCTTANGCFRKVNQTGGTSYPRNNGGWAEEISLDLDMVSAVCPNCHILLVEAKSNSFANLLAAEDYATAHAGYVSNSWSGSEFSSETSSSYDGHFNKAGVVITASTGDSGYGVGYPASSRYVVGVGGTSLRAAANTRGWSETAWSGAGSGCSAYEPQPSWQSSLGNVTSVCSRRAVADVSAVADPNTGVSVYDSYSYQGQSGWLVFGGTSVSSPLIASVFALSGNAGGAQQIYAHTSSLFDVTSGSNGSCGNDLCNAVAGWDGPTGTGTPNGTGAF